jgi:microcystin-dependent protein
MADIELFAQGKKMSGGGTVGEFFWWIMPEPPENALVCNGQAVSRAEYPELFELIGEHYGEGDGETTFNIPDARGYFIRGYDPNNLRDPQGNTRGFGTGQEATRIPYIQTYRNSSTTAQAVMPAHSTTLNYISASNCDDEGVTVNDFVSTSWNVRQYSRVSVIKTRPVNVNFLPCVIAK